MGSTALVSTSLLSAAAMPALATDTGFSPAGATVAPNGWTDPANALGGNDGVFATASGDNADQGFRDFGLGVPAGSIIDGITVGVEASSTDASGCQLQVRLSGNDGSSWTGYRSAALGGSEAMLLFGGADQTWSRTWDPTMLANGAFRVEVRNDDPGTNCDNAAVTSIDRVVVQVEYRRIDGGTANAPLSAIVCNTADFSFIIDMSGSIGAQGSVPSNLGQLKDGINGFVAAFQAAGGDGRYAGTRFNGSSASNLTAGFVAADAFMAQVSALSSPTGLTPTGAGISTGSGNDANDRDGAPNIMFVVTDGSPNVPNSHGNDLSVPETWLEGADAAIGAANDARTAGYRVKAVYLSTAGDPGDTSLPFTAAGDASWAQSVMTEIGGGGYLDADFRTFASDLFEAIGCLPPPMVEVTKTANPTSLPEPGGSVDFEVAVHNTSTTDVNLDSLVDDVFGDLDGQGTCATGGTIATGATYHCTFSADVTGNAGFRHHDTVTATVSNRDGSASDDDDAVVTISDILPSITVTKTVEPGTLPEPGGEATFSVAVRNDADEAVTLSSLVDDVFGDLDGRGTCATGGTIAIGGTYQCTFSGSIEGNAGYAHRDIVTAIVVDDDGNQASDDDDAIVTISDILPQIVVTKSADPVSLAEPGGSVEFSVSVRNSRSESVTLTSLVDDVFGNLDGLGSCATGGTIAPGATYHCSFEAPVTGNAGTIHHDTVTAVAADDDGNEATDDDDATVTLTDARPKISVEKTAFPETIAEPGGVITFSVHVRNDGVEPLTLDSLVDSVYGDLDGRGTCATGGTIAVGGEYACEFEGVVTGNAGDIHRNVVEAVASDDEGNDVRDEDDATVEITDLPIGIAVEKSAVPLQVAEPGDDVTFTVKVANTGSDVLSLDSLVDDVHGNLDGRGTCEVPQVLGPGGTYECSFEGPVSGNAGDEHRNVVTATGSDDDGNSASDDDDAVVTISDVLPVIEVTKIAMPTALGPEGGLATFEVVVINRSIEPVRITSIRDDVYGDLNGLGTCAIGAELDPDESYRCSFEGAVPGVPGDHVDIVTVIAIDDEENEATDDDDAVVTVASPTPTPEPTPTGSVAGETSKPRVTPPPTDGLGAAGDAGSGNLLAVLAILAGVSLLFLRLTPRGRRGTTTR